MFFPIRRRYKTWQIAYETIMLKYMDLCVQLQQHHQAKDGLHQYRNMAQQQAPGSLEVRAWMPRPPPLVLSVMLGLLVG